MAANRAGPSSVVVAALLLLEACHSSSSGEGRTPAPPPGLNAGLDARPSNLTCLAPAKSAPAAAAIELQRVFANVPLSQPVAMLQAPGDDSRWFVVQKGGAVRVFANTANPAANDFISVAVNASSEGGLLGMAFHPDWMTNRQVFLSFTEGSPMVSTVARYSIRADGLTADPATRVNIIRVPQPVEQNHKGGQIAFGPDGHLYFGLGDGGGGGDPHDTAQDTTDLLGSMLRLDIVNGTPYAIPHDNPFASGALCDGRPHTDSTDDCAEIYAWGLRNPWRWSFDSATGDLWVGDVGQGTLEEIDRIERGGNYGWDCREGTGGYANRSPVCTTATGLIDPVHQYGRNLGYSVTGGYVYRGSALPGLVGSYLFGDFGSGRIWHLVPGAGGAFSAEELFDFANDGLASFGTGNDGELYVVDIAAGQLHKIVPTGSAQPATPVPAQLSQTGCVNAQDPSQIATGLIPYEPAAPFWSDSATKERWLAIPNNTAIGVGADGDFSFPNGTVLMKHFRLNGALVETRLFMRHPDGDWAGYSYEWNTQRTDATLVQGGKTGPQGWIFPSSNDCLRCHTAAAGFSLGIEAAQLNRDFRYASTGRTANQLKTLDAATMFVTPLGDPALQPSMPNPFDTSAPLAQRARSYLHTNCAHCHRPEGVAQSSMDLRYATLLSGTNACGTPTQFGDLGLGAGARIIAPGSAANSVLAARMARRDVNGMPPLASSVVDSAGVALVQEWIASLTTCQ